MPTLIEQPVCFRDTAVLGDEIREFVGRISTGDTDVSISLFSFPEGWSEPPQKPEFDKYSVVFEGTLYVDTESTGTIRVKAGQGILTPKGERIQYRTSKPGGAKYIVVCLPAFALELLHQEEDGVFMQQTSKPSWMSSSRVIYVQHPAVLHSTGSEIRQVDEYFGRFNGNATRVGISSIHILPCSEGLMHRFDYDQYIGVLKGDIEMSTEEGESFIVRKNEGIVIRRGESFMCRPLLPDGADLFHVCLPARSTDFGEPVEIVEDASFSTSY